MGIPLGGREQGIRARAGAESRRPAATWWLGAAVVGLAAILGPRVVADTTGEWAWALLIPAVALWAGALFWLRRISTMSQTAVRPATVLVAVGAAAAWVMESAVVYVAAGWAGIDLSIAEAGLATAVIIAAQVLAVAPAGIGTYEAAGTAALVALGVDAGPALAAMVTAHAIKTAYALVTGAIAVTVPAPGLIGRVRLPAGRTARVERPAPEPGAPVMLFFPAHNEAAAVGGVVARVPDEV